MQATFFLRLVVMDGFGLIDLLYLKYEACEFAWNICGYELD